MVAGNERFVRGEVAHPHQDASRRSHLVDGQAPTAALFGCSDSRLAAEIIFDRGLGDLFVVRNAGQVISPSVIGSLEYAVAVLNVPLIVVLGHDECGAVRAAVDSTSPDASPLPVHIRGLIEPILPAVNRVRQRAGLVSALDADLQEVGREHLRDTIRELLDTSTVIGEAIAEGRLALVGANYRLAAGRVEPDVIVGLA
jgi:carbonic anhydrase